MDTSGSADGSQITPQQMQLLSTLMNTSQDPQQKSAGGFQTSPSAGSAAAGGLQKALMGAIMGNMLNKQQSQNAANGVTNYMQNGGEAAQTDAAGNAIGNSVSPLQFDEDGNMIGANDAAVAAEM